jgi:hypothetical protein
LLKGENEEHVVHGCPNPIESLPAPGPDRRRNEVNCPDSFTTQSRFNPKIKVWRIHTKEHIGMHTGHSTDEFPTHPPKAWVGLEDLKVPINGERFSRPPGLKPLLRQARSADSKRFQDLWGGSMTEALKQRRGQQIA